MPRPLIKKLFERTGPILSWIFIIVLTSTVVGVASVIFPPLVSIVMVGVVGLILLWATPNLRYLPDRTLKKLFFITVFVVYTLPTYYTIQVPGLPWISIRRLFLFAIIILFALIVGGSSVHRNYILQSMKSARLLMFCAIGFYIVGFLSLLTAANTPATMSYFLEVTLHWYLILFASILVVRTKEDINLLLKVIVVALLIDGMMGLIEFVQMEPLYFRIIPQQMFQDILRDNPTLAKVVEGFGKRYGMYRSLSIYNTALSFGEFAAMAGPMCAYFVFHSRFWNERILGGIGIVFCMISIFVTGARGAYIGFFIAMPIFVLLWALRQYRFNPSSLVGGILLTMFSMGTIALAGLIFFWPRLHDMVLGGADTISSNEARIVQWDMALPWIIGNPVTGYGLGNAGSTVNYQTPGGFVTLDSYVITLLVDTGIPGFLLFFGMIAVGIWMGLKIYLSDNRKYAEVGSTITCSLIAFAVYRSALSQTENHTLLFLVLGICVTCLRIYHEQRGIQHELPHQTAKYRTQLF